MVKKKSTRKTSKKKVSNSTKKKQIPFMKWEKVGQTTTGKITGFFTGQFGGIIELDKKLFVNLTQTTLVSAIKKAEHLINVGSKITIKFTGTAKGKFGNKAKLFTIIVDGETFEGGGGFKKIDKTALFLTVDSKLQSLKEKD